MPDNRNPLRGYPLSRAELRKRLDLDNPVYNFLSKYALRDTVFFYDDFLVDTINLDSYALADSAGTGKADFAINAARDGTIRGTTGTTDNGSISLITPKLYYGDANCGMEIRFKSDVVTGYNFEVGFIDAVPTSNGSGVSDVDTPAATATDAALLQIDTDQTLQTLAFVTAGSSFTTTATTLTGTTNLTAATYATARIQLVGNNAFCWLNGVLVAKHTGNKVEGGDGLALWIYVRTRDTTTKNFDVDYLAAWQDRNN